MTETEVKQINPVTLAFLGDAVYSLYVRERLVKKGEGKASDLQRTASKIVSAHGQSEFLNLLLPNLTEEETEVFKRGRNARKATKSKNALVSEYNRSTGFEAVLGYLYLLERYERITELMALSQENSYEIDEGINNFKPRKI